MVLGLGTTICNFPFGLNITGDDFGFWLSEASWTTAEISEIQFCLYLFPQPDPQRLGSENFGNNARITLPVCLIQTEQGLCGNHETIAHEVISKVMLPWHWHLCCIYIKKWCEGLFLKTIFIDTESGSWEIKILKRATELINIVWGMWMYVERYNKTLGQNPLKIKCCFFPGNHIRHYKRWVSFSTLKFQFSFSKVFYSDVYCFPPHRGIKKKCIFRQCKMGLTIIIL